MTATLRIFLRSSRKISHFSCSTNENKKKLLKLSYFYFATNIILLTKGISLHSNTSDQTAVLSVAAATGASVVFITGAISPTRASAAEASTVSWKSFARSWTHEYHGSRYSCCCSSSFLFFTGESVEFVAAVTSALRSGTVSPLGQAVNFCSAVHRCSAFLFPLPPFAD